MLLQKFGLPVIDIALFVFELEHELRNMEYRSQIEELEKIIQLEILQWNEELDEREAKAEMKYYERYANCTLMVEDLQENFEMCEKKIISLNQLHKTQTVMCEAVLDLVKKRFQ